MIENSEKREQYAKEVEQYVDELNSVKISQQIVRLLDTLEEMIQLKRSKGTGIVSFITYSKLENSEARAIVSAVNKFEELKDKQPSLELNGIIWMFSTYIKEVDENPSIPQKMYELYEFDKDILANTVKPILS